MKMPCTHVRACEVLFVEDDRSFVNLLLEHFKYCQCRFEITHVSKLQDALDILRRRHFDAILLDLNLLDSVGIHTLDNVIEQTGERVPVTVLTGDDDEETGCQAIDHGAQDYVVKDPADDHLADRICTRVRHSIVRNPRRVRYMNLVVSLQNEVEDIRRYEQEAREGSDALAITRQIRERIEKLLPRSPDQSNGVASH